MSIRPEGAAAGGVVSTAVFVLAPLLGGFIGGAATEEVGGLVLAGGIGVDGEAAEGSGFGWDCGVDGVEGLVSDGVAAGGDD
jgi:hypothetical protein